MKPMTIDGVEYYPQIVSPEIYRELMLISDTHGIYKQRRMRGVQVWRGREWWHG